MAGVKKLQRSITWLYTHEEPCTSSPLEATHACYDVLRVARLPFVYAQHLEPSQRGRRWS